MSNATSVSRIQVFARVFAIVLVTLSSANSNARLSEAEFQQAGQQLTQYAHDLRHTAEARRRMLTRADMESLGREADSLDRWIHQKTAPIPVRKSPGPVDLNVASRDVEPITESIRDQRVVHSYKFLPLKP